MAISWRFPWWGDGFSMAILNINGIKSYKIQGFHGDTPCFCLVMIGMVWRWEHPTISYLGLI